MSRDELGHAIEDLTQPRRQWIASPRADHAALDEHGYAGPAAADDAIPGVRRPRIDAEYEQPQGRFDNEHDLWRHAGMMAMAATGSAADSTRPAAASRWATSGG